MKRRDDQHIDEIIEHVRLFLAQRQGHHIGKTGSPDQDERNRRACDALLAGGGIQFAVEHTSLDSFREQRGDDTRFRAVLGELENELKGQLPDHVDLCIPTHAIPSGQDWKGFRETIRAWLTAHVKEGPYDRFVPAKVPGVPFSLHVRRERCDGPGSLFAMRWSVPEHDTQRIEIMVERLIDKAEVLERYRDQGCRTVLVLESSDNVLVSRYSLHEDFQMASRSYSPTAIDHILLVQTGTCPWCVTPLWYDGATVDGVHPCWPMAPGYPLVGTQWEGLDREDEI